MGAVGRLIGRPVRNRHSGAGRNPAGRPGWVPAFVILVAALLSQAARAQGLVYERLTIPQLPESTLNASDPPVTGYLFKPEAPGPHPAVVLLHGCDGLDWKQRTRSTWVLLSEYARRYADHGMAALVLDSFAPRGVDLVCTKPDEVSIFHRAWDAFAAARLLAARPDIDRNRLVVEGDSHGGSTALLSVVANRWRQLPEHFAAAIAFYPNCFKTGYFSAPTLILIGTGDDWTPAADCTEMMTRLARTGHADNVTLRTFPGATHAFDIPIAERTNFLGHHMKFDRDATAESWREIDGFLDRALK